jgi:NAD(P)-dependent dehydrogenase (short-subunit alcohol dehydrogenase family)
MTTSPTILITGLGRALAYHVAAAGAALILHGRYPGKLERTADDIRDAHHAAQPRTVQVHLADLSQERQMAADVQQHTDRLDALISNAGIGSGEPDGRARRTSADGYELRFAVNYLAGFLLTLDLLPLLRRSAPARIVNVASIGQHPLDFADLMLATAKSAQIGLTRSWARELAPFGITVNTVAPGFIPVERHADVPEEVKKAYLASVPAGRMGTPGDIAHAVSFLVSEGAGFITGQRIVVDGGRSLGN